MKQKKHMFQMEKTEIKYLTVKEASSLATEQLEKVVSERTIRWWIEQGYINGRKVLGSIEIDRQSLMNKLNESITYF